MRRLNCIPSESAHRRGDPAKLSTAVISYAVTFDGYLLVILGSVKSYAQNYFYGLVEIYYIYYRGRLDRPLVTIQRSGHKVSRAAQPLVLSLTLWELTAYLPGDLIALHGFQVLHVHVLLAAPLGSGNMPQPGTDQHQCGIPIRESAHNPRSAPNFPVHALNHIVGSDLRPML